MQPQIIFCPKCDALILDKPICPQCGWERSTLAPLTGEGKELWHYDARAKLHSSPVVAGDLLYFSAENGDLFALDLAAHAIWTITLADGQASEAVAVWDATLYYGEMTSHEIGPLAKCLVAVNARTGEQLWRFPTGAMNVSSPAVSQDTVYAVSSAKVLHAVDAASGQERWHAPLPSPWAPAAPLATSSLVFVPTRGNELVAVDAKTGGKRWAFSAGGWMPNTPALVDDTLYVSSWDSHLYALDARSGKVVRDFPAPKYLISAPAVDRDVVCVGCRDKCLYVFERATGKLLQKLATGRVHGAPLILDGTLFVGSEDHRIQAYDLKTLQLLWALDLGSKVQTALAYAGDSLFVAARSGLVFRVRWQPEPRETAPETYQARGEFENAATAYALRGNLPKAAALYERLGLSRQAAALYQAAGELEPAALNYERAGEIEPALALWREMNQPRRVAELLVRSERWAEVAPIYENLAQEALAASGPETARPLFIRVGEMFEKSRQFAKASDMYEQAGDLERALRVADQLGSERRAHVLERQGRSREAADLLRTKDPIKAAELYARAGGAENIRQAIALYQEQRSPELLLKARELAADNSLMVELADLNFLLGDPVSAARALERAVQEMQARLGTAGDGQAIVALLRQAAQAYREAGESERCQLCEQRILEIQKLPALALSVNPGPTDYWEGQVNIVNVLVRNAGYGLARTICLSVAGRFEPVECSVTLESLKPGAGKSIALTVCPTIGGATVPLSVTADYQSAQGLSLQYKTVVYLPVQPKSVGQTYIVQGGDVIQSGAMKTQTGDVGYAVFGQKHGDAKPTCPQCQAPVEPKWQFCPNCNKVLEQREPKGSS